MEKTIFQTLEQIKAIPVPQSEMYLKGYQAVPHIAVIDTLKEQIDKRGLGITKEVYKINKGGNLMYGSILTDMKSDNDLGGGFHFVNSYDKSKKLEIRSGAVVFICDNGMIRMNTLSTIRRKHVGSVNFDMYPMIEHAMDNLEHEYELLVSAKRQLERIEVSKQVRAELAGRLFFEHELLSVTQMSLLQRQFNKTTGPFVSDNAWSLYNNVTETLKSSHPYHYIQDHEMFHEIMMEEFV